MSTAAEELTPVSPYASFKRAVERDVKGESNTREARMLREPENLARWLRVLVRIRRETEAHTAHDHASLEAFKQAKDRQPGEYEAMRAEIQQRKAGRMYYTQHLENRVTEATELLGSQGMSKYTIGGVIETLINVEAMLDDDDLDAAHASISHLIDTLEDAEDGLTDKAAPVAAFKSAS